VNAAANYIRNGKRVYIISNEETANDFCNMIACVLTGVSHQRMSNGILTPEERATLTTKVLELFHSKQLLVFDEENTNGGTSKAEYVLDQIRALHNSDYKPDVLFIDYLTNIYAAGSLTNGDHYFQLDRFLKNLKGLINQICFPVVMCAQMHSDDKKKGNSLDTKLIMGGVIQQVSTIAVEVRVNRENLTSEFRIHKNRRFKCYDPITLKYDNGALRSLKEHEHLDEFCHLVEKMEEADEK
jgi:replicative DNA helicase